MKKLIALMLTLFIPLAAAAAVKPIRIKFPPGKTSVVVKGKTTGGPSESGGMDPITYVVRAKKGQTLTLDLTSAKKNAVFSIYAPGADLIETAVNATKWSRALPRSGDYEIIVFPRDEISDTAFMLKIGIR